MTVVAAMSNAYPVPALHGSERSHKDSLDRDERQRDLGEFAGAQPEQ